VCFSRARAVPTLVLAAALGLGAGAWAQDGPSARTPSEARASEAPATPTPGSALDPDWGDRWTAPAEIPPETSPEAAPPEALTLRAVNELVEIGRNLELESGLSDLRRGQLSRGARNVLIGAGLLAAVTLLLTLGGRRSAVHVHIDYPSQLRGRFCVRLRRRPLRGKRRPLINSPYEAQRARRASRGSSPTTHFEIGRETLMLGIPCRRAYLSVDGYLLSGESADVVATHFEEQEVRPRPGETLRIGFDFQPDACALELRVVWNESGVEEAQVARLGSPSSLRFARGAVQFSLDRGRHTLLAGANDRVAEVAIEVEDFEPRQLAIDLGDRSQLLFSGCPRAVEPYLMSDVPGAARALENEGQPELAALLMARFCAREERMEQAADHYTAAGEWGAAAEIRESLGEYRRAAELYERAGEDERAGECFRSAGDSQLAGEALMRAEDWEAAAECFREVEDVPRWIEALTKLDQHFAAAKLATERGERSQAIQCLRRVSTDSEDFPEASVLLAEAYEREGHTQLARSALEELVAARPEIEVPCEAVDRLSRLCEATGEVERAISLLEGLRRREPTWPHVATRVDALCKRRGTQTTRSEDGISTLPGTQVFSEAFRYEILEEVGRGGMGVVFRARDRRLGREVALKRLPDHIRNNPKAVELFLREARSAASLNHPNIVTVYDAGQEGDSYYMTMELLRGQPLQELLKARGGLEAGFVVKLAGQAARGLQYAHEQGIVHRDVKTANLFFTEKKVVKIMDFGLAKMVEEMRRSSTVIGGTPYYMAPEQSAGEQVDHRGDLYALGITLFELLTGKVPFRDGDISFHHRHTPAPALRDVIPEVPEALDALVADLLVKDPTKRVRSAREVVRRLAELARGA